MKHDASARTRVRVHHCLRLLALLLHYNYQFFFFLNYFFNENFNAREEHKGWTVAQSANLGVLPAKKQTNKKAKQDKKERKKKQTNKQSNQQKQTNFGL